VSSEDEQVEREWEEALAELTNQQALFVRCYVSNGYQGAKAARDAGYSTERANRAAYELKKHAGVKRALEVHWRAVAMTADEIRGRLARHARGSIAPFLDVDEAGDVRLLLGTEQARDNLDLIRKVKVKSRVLEMDDESCVSDQTVEIELHDVQGALDKLARTQGLYRDTVSVEVEDGPERAAARRAEAEARAEVLRRTLAARRAGGGEEE
jgi:hypothetical protein